METTTNKHIKHLVQALDKASAIGAPSAAAAQRSRVTEFVHVTLNTGHACVQRSDSVGPAAREFLRELIVKSRETSWVDLGLAGEKYPLRMSVDGSNLTCEVCIQAKQGPVLIVTIGVALVPSCGTDLWNSLHELPKTHALATEPTRAPQSAWIAVVLNDHDFLRVARRHEAHRYLDVLTWAADFERCLAFAFADYASVNAEL